MILSFDGHTLLWSAPQFDCGKKSWKLNYRIGFFCGWRYFERDTGGVENNLQRFADSYSVADSGEMEIHCRFWENWGPFVLEKGPIETICLII